MQLVERQLMNINIPKATHLRAITSGFFLILILFFGEMLGGKTRIVLGFIGVIWLIISGFVFISGEKSMDWLKGKRGYWKVNKPIVLRSLSYFCGMVLGAMFFKIVF